MSSDVPVKKFLSIRDYRLTKCLYYYYYYHDKFGIRFGTVTVKASDSKNMPKQQYCNQLLRPVGAPGL